MKITLFLAYFFLSFSFLNSFYLIRSNDTAYFIFYALFLVCLFFASCYYINKTKIKEIYSFFSFFKYLFIFYIFDFLLQAFYHKIALMPLFLSMASSLSAILCIFLFSKIINNDNDFIKINYFIFYLLNISLFVGIVDSLGILSINILAPTKIIEGYSFGIFKNTAGLLEHPISFGISGVLLFVISTLLNKITLRNLPYLVLLFVGVFISFSRTAYLLLLICFLLFIIHKKYISKTLFLILFSMLIASLFFVDLYNIESLNQILRLEKGLSGREFIIAFFLSIPFTLSQVLFGFGYENLFVIRDSLLTDIEFQMAQLQFRALPNLYISTLANSGILLSILYFGSQFKIYNQYIKSRLNFYNYIQLVMIIFFIGNLFVEFKIGGIRIISIYFSIILGFIFNAYSKKQNEISK